MDHNEQQAYEEALFELYDQVKTKPKQVFDFLFPIDDLDNFITGNALNYLSVLCDPSDILRNRQELQKVIELGEKLYDRELSPEESARLESILGNAQSALLHVKGELTNWDWENQDRETIIRRYRKALHSEGVEKLPDNSIQKSYTNLGNQLSKSPLRREEALGEEGPSSTEGKMRSCTYK